MSDGINVSGINSKYSESDASSGPKLTFLGRRQLATETFFFGQTFAITSIKDWFDVIAKVFFISQVTGKSLRILLKKHENTL